MKRREFLNNTVLGTVGAAVAGVAVVAGVKSAPTTFDKLTPEQMVKWDNGVNMMAEPPDPEQRYTQIGVGEHAGYPESSIGRIHRGFDWYGPDDPINVPRGTLINDT
jgi:hypothetical protein